MIVRQVKALPTAGRLVHPLRPERRGHHQRRERSRWGRACSGPSRASCGQEVHEDRLFGPRSSLNGARKQGATRCLVSRIRKNDTVEVISGKDKGKRGRVIEVLPKVARVRVEGVNKDQAPHEAEPAEERRRAASWSEKTPSTSQRGAHRPEVRPADARRASKVMADGSRACRVADALKTRLAARSSRGEETNRWRG